MKKIEQKAFSFFEDNINYFFLFLITAIGVAIRFNYWDSALCDGYGYIAWYNQLKENGGLNALSNQIGEYSILWQFVVAIMTYIPINCVLAYKILTYSFDFFQALAISLLTGEVIHGKNKNDNVILSYTMAFISPIVIYNSGKIVNCDSIFNTFILFSILFLLRRKNFVAFILLGLSFSWKLQAIFLIPFFFFIYLLRKDFSIIYFIVIPLMMLFTSIPGMIAGRSVADIFSIYVKQTSLYSAMSFHYPTIWNLVQQRVLEGYVFFDIRDFAILMCISVLLCVMFYWKKQNVFLSKENMLCMSFLLTYICVLILPGMHERYSYTYELLAIPLLFLGIGTVFPFILLYALSLSCYAPYLYGGYYSPLLYSCINLGIFIFYFSKLNQYILQEDTSQDTLTLYDTILAIYKKNRKGCITLTIVSLFLFISIIGLSYKVYLHYNHYIVDGSAKDVITYSDFHGNEEKSVTLIEKDRLVFSGGGEEREQVFYSRMNGTDFQRILIDFRVRIPRELSTPPMNIELIGNNYNYPEQKRFISLHEGENHISYEIDKGKYAPTELYFRIIAPQNVHYEITDLHIKRMERVYHKGDIWIWAFFVIIFVSMEFLIMKKLFQSILNEDFIMDMQ